MAAALCNSQTGEQGSRTGARAGTPLVSVVVPAFNAEATLRQAVDSILRQTVTDLEVIVVDDGSSDGTCARASETGDPRVRAITQMNAGPSVARNHGASIARGRYLAFLDADDMWLPRKLERQLAMLTERPGVGAVQCGVYHVDENLRVIDVRPCVSSGNALWDAVNFRNLPAFPSTVLFQREAFEHVGPFDTTLTGLEDWEMAIRTAWRCGLASVQEPLALYRMHPGNRSRGVDINVEPGFSILGRLFSDSALPEQIRRRHRSAYSSFYRSLAGGYFQRRRYWECALWTARALWADPRQVGYMAALPIRAVGRRLARSCPVVWDT